MLESIASQIRKVLPGKAAALGIIASFGLGVLVSTGGISCKGVPERPTPLAPLTPQGFVRLGKTYTSNLGKVYASAWEAGAASLEAGKPVATALDAVHEAWERDRLQLYRRFVTVEFDKVIPEGKAEAETTAAQRAILAKAWRGFAAGLRQ